MNIVEAQRDMREAYFSGATGALASGLVWLASGVVSLVVSPAHGVVTLFIGGIFIFPLSVLFSKIVGCSGKHSSENPFAKLALESTFYMLLCFPIAAVVFLYNSAWFFPAMLLNISGRYLIFQTLYGKHLYWIFSAVLVLGAGVLVVLRAGPAISALAGGTIEVVFAVALFVGHRSSAT